MCVHMFTFVGLCIYMCMHLLWCTYTSLEKHSFYLCVPEIKFMSSSFTKSFSEIIKVYTFETLSFRNKHVTNWTTKWINIKKSQVIAIFTSLSSSLFWIFMTGFLSVSLTVLELILQSGLAHTHRDLPTCASWVLELKTCATTALKSIAKSVLLSKNNLDSHNSNSCTDFRWGQ